MIVNVCDGCSEEFQGKTYCKKCRRSNAIVDVVVPGLALAIIVSLVVMVIGI